MLTLGTRRRPGFGLALGNLPGFSLLAGQGSRAKEYRHALMVLVAAKEKEQGYYLA
jgi:hypothetical protein